MGVKLLRVRAATGDSLRASRSRPLGAPPTATATLLYTYSRLLPLPDGLLVLTGQLNNTGFAACYDSLLQPLWTYVYEPPTPTARTTLTQVLPRPDGSLLVLGFTQNPSSPTYSLHQLASNSGRLLARYPLTSRVCQRMLPINLVAGPQDSIVFVTGGCQDAGNSAAYFARVNLNGLRPVTSTTPMQPAALLQLFPNPATDQLTVQYPAGAVGAELRLYSVLGQLLQTELLPASGNHTFSIRNLPAGTYSCVLRQNGQPARPRRFVVLQ